MTKKIKLTDEQKASLLAGGTEIELEASQLPTPEPAPAPPAPAASAPAATPPAPTPPAPPETAVSLLQGQLTAAQGEVTRLLVENATLKATDADNKAVFPELLGIARSHLNAMQVAMGASGTADALNAKDAVAEYKRIRPLWEAKFPAGGISRPAAEAAGDKKVTEIGNEMTRRMAAVTIKA